MQIKINRALIIDFCQESGDQHRINPNGTSEILEDSIPGILEGILTPSSPVDRKARINTHFIVSFGISPF